jgi:hypothetical protein
MKNKYRVFQIALIIFLSTVVALFGIAYGPFFMAVFFGLIGILAWSFFLRKGK